MPQEFCSRGHIAHSTGTGMVYNSVADPDHVSEGLETNFWVKYLNSLMRIRDGKNSDPR